MSINMLPFWIPRVAQVMGGAGVPWPVWVAIAFEESTFNPDARNNRGREDSVGLFQLNRNGGQGSGYSVEQLKNPELNATIAARYIGPAVQQCGPDKITCICVNSGHPGQVSQSDARVQRIKRTYDVISKLDFVPAIQGLIAGMKLPDVPDFPSLDPLDMGRGLALGVGGTIREQWQNLLARPKDEIIKLVAPWALTMIGLSILFIGIFGLVVKSPPAK